MNLSSWVLDHYDMLEAEQVTRDTLEKVAQAMGSRLMTPEERSRQMDTDFGIVLVASGGAKSRKFPINTAFDTYMSKAAFVMNGRSMPDGARNIAEERISAAARRYRLPLADAYTKTASFGAPSNVYILTHRDELNMEAAPMVKTASSSRYAINESLDGSPIRKFSIDTTDQVKRRVSSFETKANRMHIKYAFQYADNVAQRAEELGMKIPETSKIALFKAANLNPQFKSHIAARIRIAPKEMEAPYLGLMLKTASTDARQLAVALDSIDRSCGIDMLYGRSVTSPAEAILTTVKKANVVEVGSLSVDIDRLKDALTKSPEAFGDFLEPDTLEALINDTETVFNALPVPFKQQVIHTMENNVS